MAKSFRPFFRPRKHYKKIVMPLVQETINHPEDTVMCIVATLERIEKEYVGPAWVDTAEGRMITTPRHVHSSTAILSVEILIPGDATDARGVAVLNKVMELLKEFKP